MLDIRCQILDQNFMNILSLILNIYYILVMFKSEADLELISNL